MLRFFSLLFICLTTVSLQAGYIVSEGKLMDKSYLATMSAEKHFEAGAAALEAGPCREAMKHFRIVVYNYPDSALADEALYFLAVSFFKGGDFDLANQTFSDYLALPNHSKYFEETVRYKFFIAEKFAQGHKKHVFGMEKMPKWAPAFDESITIYDEIISILPQHDFAARALFAKGSLMLSKQNFRECHEVFNLFLHRFPKHELAPQTYTTLAHLFLEQHRAQPQNPDLLALANINRKKFSEAFPNDSRIEKLEDALVQMKEVYAEELYSTGQLYERKKEPTASVLYYSNTILQYPNTDAARLSKERLKELEDYAIKLDLPKELWQ